MAYCGPRGIALSVFLGWAPEDQAAALAWQAHESRRCSGCGSHPDDGPLHPHINVCPVCVQLDKARSKPEAQVTGAHVVLAAGSIKTCDRCMTEIKANYGG